VRVGIDARALAAQYPTGVENYVINLLLALARLDDAPEIIAYLDRPPSRPTIAAALPAGNVTIKVIRAPVGWLRLALPLHLLRDRVRVAQFPSTILPPLLPCPAVVTVHDLAWLHHPETYERDDLEMQRLAIRSAGRAARVIAVSEATAADLQAARFDPKRITVIHLGVSASFRPDGPTISPHAFPGAGRLAGGYLLYNGTLRARKNLRRLLKAYHQVCAEVPAPPLVLAGKMTAYGEELSSQARGMGIADQVVFPGYVPDELLPALYRGATILVYPSLYEGFGLQILEAMACGTPVITSNTSSMPEVAGDAALLVDPGSVPEIAAGLKQMLTDQQLRRSLSQRGLARSRQFTWERTARETAAVYRQMAPEQLHSTRGR
jgi:glycosyltransferase involved in cell wall biosynthesis